jgi:voltage-gated potassium channel Kch
VRVTIVGGGEIGFALARSLALGHDVSVVDHAAAVGDRFESLDVQFLHGPGASATTLRRAGAEKADVLVACTGLDEVNIVALMAAGMTLYDAACQPWRRSLPAGSRRTHCRSADTRAPRNRSCATCRCSCCSTC